MENKKIKILTLETGICAELEQHRYTSTKESKQHAKKAFIEKVAIQLNVED